MSRFFAATYDLCMWPGERLRMRVWRARAVSGLTGCVLELGAGSGLNVPHDRGGIEVVAVEPDPHMRGRAEQRARAASAPITLIDARAEDLPFPDQEFNAAVITLVLCPVGDVARSLGEVRRVLRPGAAVRLIEHVRAPQAPLAAVQVALTPLQRRSAGNCHLDRRTLTSLRDAGFIVEEQRSHGGGSLLELSARAPDR